MEYFERRRTRREATRPAAQSPDPAHIPQPDRGIAEVMIKLVERDLESGTAEEYEWLPDGDQLRLAGITIGEYRDTFLRGYQLALLRLPTHAFPEPHDQQIEAELKRRIATLDQLRSRRSGDDP